MALISLDFIYKAIDRYNASEDQRQARSLFEGLLRFRAETSTHAHSSTPQALQYGLFVLNSVIAAFPGDVVWRAKVLRCLELWPEAANADTGSLPLHDPELTSLREEARRRAQRPY